jgi:hypothetical protein
MGKNLPAIVVEGVREGVLYEAEAKGCVLYKCFDSFVGGSPPMSVRWVRITLEGRYAQWKRHISIEVREPRKRKREFYYLTPDGGAWYTIKRMDGEVEFDSRTVFPCYASLEECREQNAKRHGYGPGPENEAAVARWDAVVADLKLQGRLPNDW